MDTKIENLSQTVVTGILPRVRDLRRRQDLLLRWQIATFLTSLMALIGVVVLAVIHG